MAATKYFIYPWAISGDVDPVSDASVSPVLSYFNGFTVNYEEPLTTSGALPIPRGQFNQVMNDVTSNLANWQQNGIYPFITSMMNGGTAFPYAKGALCAYDSGDGSGLQIWQSLVATNTTTPAQGANWNKMSGGGLPIGAFMDFGGTTAPSGFLLCDGSAVSQTAYAALFAAIGNTWLNSVTPPGSGNFNLPNLLRRYKMGSGGTVPTTPVAGGINSNTVGSTGGEESHVQTTAELNEHNHNGTGTVAGADDVSGGDAGFSHHASTLGTAQSVPITTVNAGNGVAFNELPPTAIVLPCIRAF